MNSIGPHGAPYKTELQTCQQSYRTYNDTEKCISAVSGRNKDRDHDQKHGTVLALGSIRCTIEFNGR